MMMMHNASEPNQRHTTSLLPVQFIMHPLPPVWLSSSKIRIQNIHHIEKQMIFLRVS